MPVCRSPAEPVGTAATGASKPVSQRAAEAQQMADRSPRHPVSWEQKGPVDETRLTQTALSWCREIRTFLSLGNIFKALI